jgi:hypothetical protein
MESVFSVNGLFISMTLRNTSQERYEREHDKVNVYVKNEHFVTTRNSSND